MVKSKKSMLELDNSKWSQLTDAYGSASKIPTLLKQISHNPEPKTSRRDEPWFSLWSSLCHQGDVYTASYASVPHIMRIALDNESKLLSSDFFLLPAAIEIARVRHRGPDLPKELESEYRSAITEMGRLAGRYKSNDPDLRKSLEAMRLVANGQVEDAENLLDG